MLAGLIGGAAVLALDACSPGRTPGPSETLEPTRAASRPVGQRALVKGFNISPRPADYAYTSPWTGLWSNWDWEGKIRRDIDLGLALGGTVVRIIGAPAAVLSGALDEAIYFARMQQVLEYCRSRKVRFYAVGGSVRAWTPDSLPTSALQSHFVTQAQVLGHDADTVFGFDINNELMNAYSTFREADIRAIVGNWAAAVKAAVPAVRVTVSNYAPYFRGGYLPYPEIDTHLDFFDNHVSRLMSAGAIASWRAQKPLVLGEVQIRRDAADRRATYDAIGRAAVEGGAEAVLTWDVASTDFGLYDAQGQHLDPELAGAFAALSR